MDATFMNSDNSKPFDTEGPLLNLPDEIDLKWVIYMLLYKVLAYTIHEKI